MHQKISQLKNEELKIQFERALKQETHAISQVILYLSEIDRRKLYLEEAYSSLFSYCVEKCHYSEGAAYRRIQAARLSQQFPEIITLLSEGEIHLTSLCLIAPHLNAQNASELFSKVQYKSKKEIEKVVASMFPTQELIPDTIRRLPAKKEISNMVPLPNPGSSAHPFVYSKPKEVIKHVSFQDVKIEFRANQSLASKIQRAKDILRHKYPEGKLEDILTEAIDLLLQKKDPERKVAAKPTSQNTKISDSNTRYVPQRVKLAVYHRDSGQCAYVSPEGRRCQERGAIEIDHIQPYALGGSTSVENLRLLCQNHNRWRAQKTFQTSPAFASGGSRM